MPEPNRLGRYRGVCAAAVEPAAMDGRLVLRGEEEALIEWLQLLGQSTQHLRTFIEGFDRTKKNYGIEVVFKQGFDLGTSSR
jgi:hypothetical protein